MVDVTQDFKTMAEMSSSVGYNLATALQLRLDTSLVLRDIECYLRGVMEEIVQDDKGNMAARTVWKGSPLVNGMGLQWIMNFAKITLSTLSVQGNFLDYDMYADYLERTRKDFSTHLMTNFYTYELSEHNYGGVISTFMRAIEAYYTRLLFNEERKSYAQTIKSVESTQTQPVKKGFHLPFT